jgi:hypothetical protein
MSFAADLKHEICQDELDAGQSKAQLAALLYVKASLHMNWQGMYITFQIENAAVAKHMWMLLKANYETQPRLSVLKKMNLKKNNIYRIQIYDMAQDILEDLGILDEKGLRHTPAYSLVRKEKDARAFLAGCFLASGSINSPKTSNYHMEISAQNEELAESIRKMMERFHLPAKIAKRKNSWVVYMKTSDKIGDFLRLCNASQSLLEFEDTRISRDFYNQMKRLDNCELANEMKSMKAAQEQLLCIELVETNVPKSAIPEKLQKVMDVRRQHPDATITELCDEIYAQSGEIISKSGMKHRLAKIKEMAQPYKEAMEKDARSIGD